MLGQKPSLESEALTLDKGSYVPVFQSWATELESSRVDYRMCVLKSFMADSGADSADYHQLSAKETECSAGEHPLTNSTYRLCLD